jgi:hypothetical protein
MTTTSEPAVTALTREVFGAVDSLDSPAFAAFFAPDGRITFGNSPALEGRETVEAGTAGFLGSIDGIHHEVVHEWNVGADTIVELQVTYTRKDGNLVTIPAVSIWTVDAAGLITDYRVTFDTTPVFA